MLDLNRNDVLKYLTAIGQDFRTDATNQDTRWTRSRLRHETLPHLRERYNQQVDAALLRLAAQAGEVQKVVAETAVTLVTKCVDANSSRVTVDCVPLLGQPAIVVREVFKSAWRQAGWGEQSMGFDEWQQLAALAAEESPQMFNLPGGRRAQRDRQFVVVEVLAK
jgi:tRNA(Ile)-lysidine synthase